MRANIKFGPYQPDRANTSGANLEVANNVLPSADGYIPLPAFSALDADPLPGYPYGGAAVKGVGGLSNTFVGTATNLYRFSGTEWTEIGSGYSASDAALWSFQQFGNRMVATNGSDAPQYTTLDSSDSFAALPGDGDQAPPRMKMLAVVRDFLVGGYVDGNALQVQWSGINNSSEWRVGIGQSDFNIFPDGGEVTALAGGEYGLVFQSNCIRRMDYVGGDVIFTFNVISPEIGCTHQRAFCQIGRLAFFWSERGFMVCDGNSVTPIGDEEVDRTFAAEADVAYYARMSCVADPVRKMVFWSVPAENPTKWYGYHWGLKRWVTATQAARLLFSGLTRDIGIDEPGGSPDTGESGLSFDDPLYKGGQPAFYLINASNVLGTMTGAPAEATLGMGPIELAGGAQTLARRWRLDGDPASGVTLTLDARQRIGDAASVTTHTGPTGQGDVVGRRRGRSIAPTWTIAAGTTWAWANGFSVEFERGGGR